MRQCAIDVELEGVELWVANLDRTAQILSAFGFEVDDAPGLESRPDERAACLTSGNVSITLRQGTEAASPVARYVAAHGDGVGDLILACRDVANIADRALACGLKATVNGACARIDMLGDGTMIHSVRAGSDAARHRRSHRGSGLHAQGVDHVTYCLPFGTMERVARAYREVLGLADVPVEDCAEVGDTDAGMRSLVLRSRRGLTIVLTEPRSPASSGQTQQFVSAHAGAGVQHIALAYDDLAQAVHTLRSRGVAFLRVPREHLDRSHRRFSDRALPWEALRREEILVDADEAGLLLQLFTRPLTSGSGFFFELIHRQGAKGFGAANVRALFAAIDASLREGTSEAPVVHSTAHDRHATQARWTSDLIRSARERVPFYHEHLASAAASDLRDVPTFEKSMTVRFGRFPMSAGGAPGAHRVLATSGTSGRRLYVSFDEREWNRTGNWLASVGRRVGVTSDDVLLNTHCYGLWVGGPALDLLATRCGAGLVPLGPMGPAIVLELLGDRVGTAISATPSYMRRLIETADATGFDLRQTSLRFGFIGAEPAEESLRQKLLSRLPDEFRWVELYGLTETAGPSVAFAPDPAVPELELNTADYVVEVLDPVSDHAVPFGQVGELTITTRRSDGRTPLVRYRTRDLARATAGPAAAPTRISRILGRSDHSLKIGGVLLYPSAVADIMSELLPATSEWRAVVQRRSEDDELLIEAEASRELCQSIERAFRERVGVGLTVNPLQPDALSRSREKTRRILIDSSSAPAACR